jgi:Predicted pyridoxal phosphate-dependent enzyme apparently involved in regulation of cell wall biogenesis
MPGFELIDNKEKKALSNLFDEGGVLFAHGFDALRKKYHVREFEENLSKYFESEHSLCVSSGTAAIKCTLAAYGIKEGDEVITQSFNFIATLEAIHDIGATPVVIGIDDSLNMCPDLLEKNITNKTKAIMPVHMLGVPAEMKKIIEIADLHNIPVIEDACEAVGAKYDNKFVGTLCDYGIFSFDFGKNITTGEGGAILSKNANLDKLVREYHDHGHQNIENLPRGLDLASRPGFNYRMGEMNAVVGKEQLKKLDFILEENKKR